MPKQGKYVAVAAAAIVMLILQLVGASTAAAAQSSDVQVYKACSDIGIGLWVGGDNVTVELGSEIAYHGNDCGDQAAAMSIRTALWACRSDGTYCFGVGTPDYSNDVGSYDFFDSRLNETSSTGYSYKFCVTLQNGDLERYSNVCTGLVSL